jgi:hypothetical protein
MQRMNPKMGWTEMFKEDKSRLDHGMSGYNAYDSDTHDGKAMAHVYVNATPAQVAGFYADPSNNTSIATEVLDSSYTTMTGVIQIPIPIPAISDRESLYRSAWLKHDEENSYMFVAYTTEDERRPVGGGKVRVLSEAKRWLRAI